MLLRAVKSRLRLALIVCLTLVFSLPSNLVYATDSSAVVGDSDSDPTVPSDTVGHNYKDSPLRFRDLERTVALVVGLIDGDGWTLTEDELQGFSVPKEERKNDWLTDEVVEAWSGQTLTWMNFQRAGRTEPKWGDIDGMFVVASSLAFDRGAIIIKPFSETVDVMDVSSLDSSAEFNHVIPSSGADAGDPGNGGMYLKDIADTLTKWFKSRGTEGDDPKEYVLGLLETGDRGKAKQILRYMHAGLIGGTNLEHRMFDVFMLDDADGKTMEMYGNNVKLKKLSDSRSVLVDGEEEELLVPIEEAEEGDMRSALNIAQYLDVLVTLGLASEEFGEKHNYVKAVEEFFGTGETVKRSEDLNFKTAVYVGAASAGNNLVKHTGKAEIVPYFELWLSYSYTKWPSKKENADGTVTNLSTLMDGSGWAGKAGAATQDSARQFYWLFDFHDNPLFRDSAMYTGTIVKRNSNRDIISSDKRSAGTKGVSNSATRQEERAASLNVDISAVEKSDNSANLGQYLPAANVVGRATTKNAMGGTDKGPFFFIFPIIPRLNPAGGFTHSITATPDGSSTSKYIDVQPATGTLDKVPTVEYRIGTGFNPDEENVAYSDPTYTEQLQMLFESLDSRGATYTIQTAFWREVTRHDITFLVAETSSWPRPSFSVMTKNIKMGIKAPTKAGFDTSQAVTDVHDAEPHDTDSAMIMSIINGGVMIDFKEEAGSVAELVEKAAWPVIEGATEVFTETRDNNVQHVVDVGANYFLDVQYSADTLVLIEIDGEKYELNYDGHARDYALVAYQAKNGTDLAANPLNIPAMFAKAYPDEYKPVSDTIGYKYYNEGSDEVIPASPEIDIKVWTPFAVYSSTPEAYAELKNWGIASRTEPGDTWRGDFIGGKDGDTTDTFTGFPGDNGDGDKKNLAVVNDYGLFNDSRTGIGDTRVPLDTGAGAGRTSDGTGIIGEDYEAMSGVPSTELLYLAVGGSEFIIDIAVQYVPNETAVRSYWARFNSVNCFFDMNMYLS